MLGILRLSPALLVDAVRHRLWWQQQQATDELCGQRDWICEWGYDPAHHAGHSNGSLAKVVGTDCASRTDVKLPCSLEKHAHTQGPLSRSYCSSRRHAIAKYLPWDYFRLPAKRSCEFFDSALSCLAGRFLMFEKIEAAPQQLDTTGPAQPDGRHGSRRGGYRYQVE